MAGADRAINMALRVQGIGDVERDFKRAGDAGERSFSRVEKAANGAAQEISDYHARLKRVALDARAQAANLPDLNKGNALTAARARNSFVLDRVNAEKSRIRSGLPDLTLPGAADGTREANLFAAALEGVGGKAGIAGLALTALGGAVAVSVAQFAAHEAALAKFNATLSFSGNASNATAREIQQMAEKVAEATLQTQESSLAAAAAIARVPGITLDVLTQATEASARFADAMGTDVQAEAEKTATVLSALAKNDLKALVNSLDDVSDATFNTVIQLAQAGKSAEAQQVYLKALADAAGDGPNGLTRKIDQMNDKWRSWAQTVGGFTVDTALAGMSLLERGLNGVRNYAELTNSSLLKLLFTLGSAQSASTAQDSARGSQFGTRDDVSRLLGTASPSAKAAAERQRVTNGILSPVKPPRASGGGRGAGRGGGGASSADREGDRLKREAEQARTAADRVRESNDDVVETYRRRAQEASEMLGLEGLALEAVQRRHEIDATVRRLSTEAIEKEVAARRAEAAAAGKPFDEAAARAVATAALEKQTDALRQHAEAAYDDAEAQKDFLRQQERAAQIWEATRTPIERIKNEVSSLVDLLRGEVITPDVFDRRIRQLADDMVDAAGRVRNEWTGVGDEVAGSLKNIIFNGGGALDVLRELVGITAGRLFDANVGNPLADAIDGLTGNSRDKQVAAARAALPTAADVAAGSVSHLGVNADVAAAALGRIGSTGDVGGLIGGLGGEASTAANAMRTAASGAYDFSSAAARFVASIAQGGGGGGGLLGTLLNVGLSAVSAGGSAKIGNGGGAIKALGKTPGFAGGGYPPIGVPFDVGENGRERMILIPGGGARVFSGDQTRRMANDNGSPTVIQNNIHIPAGADPRLTRDAVNRGTQVGLSRAAKKGLAAPARFR